MVSQTSKFFFNLKYPGSIKLVLTINHSVLCPYFDIYWDYVVVPLIVVIGVYFLWYFLGHYKIVGPMFH